MTCFCTVITPQSGTATGEDLKLPVGSALWYPVHQLLTLGLSDQHCGIATPLTCTDDSLPPSPTPEYTVQDENTSYNACAPSCQVLDFSLQYILKHPASGHQCTASCRAHTHVHYKRKVPCITWRGNISVPKQLYTSTSVLLGVSA